MAKPIIVIPTPVEPTPVEPTPVEPTPVEPTPVEPAPAPAPVIVTTPAPVAPIVALRTRAVEAEVSSYGARREYAKGINDLPGVHTAWYMDGEKLPASIATEKGEYYKALKAIKYKNPSNAWKMVKHYAREDARERGLFGEVAPETTEGGEGGEGEGEGGDTRETRSLTLRLVEELTTLHKAALKTKTNKPEEYTEKVSMAHHHVINALKSMGVDIGI